MRVATLVPAATETVFALGVRPVAVSHACDFPPTARGLPALDRTRVDPDADPASIDEQVSAAMAEHGSVYEIDTDRLAAADPDVLVTQGVCEVCAVADEQARRAAAAAGVDPAVVSTHPHTLAETYEDVRRVGAALDRPAVADRLVDRMRTRVAAVESAVPDGADRPRVLVLDWTDPPMVAGHWVPELVRLAGGEPVLATPGERSGPVEWGRVREAAPEVVVVPPCGFGVERAGEALADLRDRPGWTELPAVRAGRVHAVDGNHLFNRPGPRLVETLETLAALVHPGSVAVPDPGYVAGPLPGQGSGPDPDPEPHHDPETETDTGSGSGSGTPGRG